MMRNGKWTVDAATEGAIVQNETNLDFCRSKVIEKGRRVPIKKVLKHRIQEVFRQLQHELHADLVDFSKEFYWKYPKRRKTIEDHWDEMFSEMEVNINVQAHIRREGYITSREQCPYRKRGEKKVRWGAFFGTTLIIAIIFPFNGQEIKKYSKKRINGFFHSAPYRLGTIHVRYSRIWQAL